MSKGVTVTIKMRSDGSLFVKGFPTLKQNYEFLLGVTATLAATVDPLNMPVLEKICKGKAEAPEPRKKIISIGKGGNA